jgi:hypothetical protein
MKTTFTVTVTHTEPIDVVDVEESLNSSLQRWVRGTDCDDVVGVSVRAQNPALLPAIKDVLAEGRVNLGRSLKGTIYEDLQTAYNREVRG